ncbi:hypothetical protein TcCL_Unassigned05584, partial [Trypanosoma cruzi]
RITLSNKSTACNGISKTRFLCPVALRSFTSSVLSAATCSLPPQVTDMIPDAFNATNILGPLANSGLFLDAFGTIISFGLVANSGLVSDVLVAALDAGLGSTVLGPSAAADRRQSSC